MASLTDKTQYSLAFLTIIEVENLGACGGLLVVNHLGRPVEFHCTAPVAANRTQEILYGRSLKSFLFCDQIGATLYQRAKTKIDAVIASDWTLLGLTSQCDCPLVILNEEKPDQSSIQISPLKIGKQEKSKAFTTATGELLPMIQNILADFSQTLPLDEPFERIEIAIDEAQSAAHSSAPARATQS